MKRSTRLITLVVSGQKFHYQIQHDLRDAMELVCKLKDEKAVTDLSTFGGSELVLIDWRKVALVELSEIDIDNSDDQLTEQFGR